MQRKYKLMSTFLLSAMVAVACANENKQKSQQAPDEKETVELTVSAAASLKDAFYVIQDAYQEENPEVSLKFNFGGSGSLQQQISQGAPADLFFSAAEDKFDLLVEDGTIAKEDGLDLLGNELVLIVPKGKETITNFNDLATADFDKISIGTPETVPVGKYAKESLQKTGIWTNIESKIVYAKDVRQVLSYVETGNVDAGIVYKTDALISDKVTIVASADASTHAPIIYPIGIIKDSKQFEAAKEFYTYLQSDEAIKVFEEYGFTTK